jgi:hypothetical protein
VISSASPGPAPAMITLPSFISALIKSILLLLRRQVYRYERCPTMLKLR